MSLEKPAHSTTQEPCEERSRSTNSTNSTANTLRHGDIFSRSINDLPAELLEHIFAFFTMDSCTSDPGQSAGTRIAPLLLTHVCRLWNILTVARADFWSTLPILNTLEFGANRLHKSEKFFDLIDLFLRRSKGRRLTLSCNATHEHNWNGFNIRTLRVFRRYLQELHRWADVDLRLGDEQLDEMVEILAPSSSTHAVPFRKLVPQAPLLTHLSLDFTQCSRDSRAIELLGNCIGNACPNLVSLNVKLHDQGASSLLTFPLARLQAFALDSPCTARTLAAIVSCLSNATSIFLKVDGYVNAEDEAKNARPFAEPPRAISPKRSPHVKSFRLSCKEDSLVDILKLFELPSLESLEIEVWGASVVTQEDRRESLHGWLRKSSFALEMFHLHDESQESTIRCKSAFARAKDVSRIHH